ncbi:MAG: PEP-CTERM sorting domain-containing protein [Fimbriimonadaceae bacterium]|nr:PEP-CTERM sorting domain-containing protein [Fimbriimonadaceae bacterium]
MNRITTLATLAACSSLSFASINLHVNGLEGGLHSTVHVNYNGNNKDFSAGPQTGHLGAGPDFRMFCVDLDHTVSPGSDYQVNPTLIPTMGNAGMTLAAKLYNSFAGGVTTADEGAGLQMAIWEAVVDNGAVDFSSGNFKDNGTAAGIMTKANFYLANIGSNDAAYFLDAVHIQDKNQSMIGPVPEPASMSVLALGAAGLLRRRNKKA